jgi:hypothetical protein
MGFALQAGLVYALVVFAAGILCGAARVLLLVPRVGAAIAVLLESPIMLTASWWVSRSCVARFKVSATASRRIFMGLVALVTLTAAEIGLAALAFGKSPMGYLLDLESSAGAIGLSAQLALASFPLLQAISIRRTRGPGAYPPYERQHRQ